MAPMHEHFKLPDSRRAIPSPFKGFGAREFKYERQQSSVPIVVKQNQKDSDKDATELQPMSIRRQPSSQPSESLVSFALNDSETKPDVDSNDLKANPSHPPVDPLQSPPVLTLTPFGPIVTFDSHLSPLPKSVEASASQNIQSFSTSQSHSQFHADHARYNRTLNANSVRRWGITPDTWPGNLRAGILALLTKNANSNATLPVPSSADDLNSSGINDAWQDQNEAFSWHLATALTNIERRRHGLVIDDTGTVYELSRPPVKLSHATTHRSQHEHEHDLSTHLPIQLSTSTNASRGCRTSLPNDPHTSTQASALPDTSMLSFPLLSHPINRDHDGDIDTETLVTHIERQLQAHNDRLHTAKIHQETQRKLHRRKRNGLLALFGSSRAEDAHNAEKKQQHRKAKGFFKPTLSGRHWCGVDCNGLAIMPAPVPEIGSHTGHSGRLGRMVKAICAVRK